MPRGVISDIEVGRRRCVTTAELCALASALRVPVCLLYPELPDGMVETTPGVPVRSIDAVMWFSGEAQWKSVPDIDPTATLSADELVGFQADAVLDMSREREMRKRELQRLAKLAGPDAAGSSTAEFIGGAYRGRPVAGRPA